jgi:putative transposase
MIYRLVRELAEDADLQVDVTVACRVLKVSRSGYYEWLGRAPSARQVADEALSAAIAEVHEASRGVYGAPRVHAELRLGLGLACGRKRVARLMRTAGLAGVCHRRKHRRAGPAPAVHDDLVQRRFVADAPDRLWVTDITEHPTAEGKVYCAAVLDVFSRVVVGWSVADHMRAELVVDALEMARWRRRPESGAVVHSDREARTRRGFSATGCAPPACSAPWVGSPPASTTA